jgi:hypothetical protein
MRKLFLVVNSIFAVIIIFWLVLGWANSGFASDPGKATKEECVAKCKEAAELIQKTGLDIALKQMNDPNGPFIWKDSYVFCFGEEDFKILAHRVPRIVGWNTKNYRSADGRLIFQEMVKVANAEGSGWITYDYLRRGEQEARPKTTYFLKVPGTNVIVGAGYYE